MAETETITTIMPAIYAGFPTGGAIALPLLALLVWYLRRRKGLPTLPSTFVWMALVSAVLAFLAVWGADGLIEAHELTYLWCTSIITLLGAIMLLRDYSFDAILALDESQERPKTAHVLRGFRDAALILAAAQLSRIALDLSWNELVWDISWVHALISLVIIGLPMAALYFLAQRRGLGAAPLVAACVFIGIAEYFVIRFKGAGIVPADLFALGTAAEVSGGFTYYLPDAPVIGITVAVGAWCALAFIQPAPGQELRSRATVKNLLCALAAAVGIVAFVTVPSFKNDFGINVTYWTTYAWHQTQGFLPTFFRAVQDIAIPRPEGYSAAHARELEQDLAAAYDSSLTASEKSARAAAEAQFAAKKPNIIFIMDEAFSDVSIYKGETWGYTGPEFFTRGIDDAVLRGDLRVSVLGGGTCNTEFEVLTGTSLAFLGSGKYPYQMYDFANVPSLARQLEEQGYATYGIHPNKPDNWNRGNAYKSMGMDDFIDIEDFEGAPRFHNGVTNQATFEKALELVRESSEPLFIYDVTMQGHSGYDVGNIPAELLPSYAPAHDAALDAQLNEYLACVDASDRDLAWFVDELRALSEPVVIVYYGDHQPKLTADYNKLMFDLDTEGYVPFYEREYVTPYLMWANFEIAGAEGTRVEEVGADCLAALVLSRIGAPLTDYQKAQLEVHKTVTAINSVGYRDANGAWHAIDEVEGDAAQAYHDMATMSYLEFGSKF